MFVANLLVSSMKVLHIFLVNVGRSYICSSSKPPYSTISFKIPVVEVHCWAMRVLWVHYTRETACEERNTLSRSHALCAINTTFGGSLKSFLRHASIDNGKIHSCLFKNFSVRQDTRHTTATIGSNPCILLEFRLPINFLNSFCDRELCFTNHFFKLSAHRIVAIWTRLAFAYKTFRDLFDCFVRIPTNINRRCLFFLLPLLGVLTISLSFDVPLILFLFILINHLLIFALYLCKSL
mmetsp:Transcript_11096/g.14508  ORF Transcript_11096/g.14508 Transcript_11096/m.14508 type:complete len:237 (+) Transcript_11096:489-1199(+)